MTVPVRRLLPRCPACQGRGALRGHAYHAGQVRAIVAPCRSCNGQGRVASSRRGQIQRALWRLYDD